LSHLYSDDEIREASLVSADIQALAESTLSSAEIEQATTLTQMLLLTEDSRQRGKALVCTLAPTRPKRPLFYAVSSLWQLPEEARSSMKYFGDYVDILVKSWARLVTGDPRSLTRSLGINISAIDRSLHPGPDFLDFLESYDNAIYVPAKHDFELPEDRSIHRFTATEALLTAHISAHLAELISIQYALQLTEGIESAKTSVSTAIIDPISRVLVVSADGQRERLYDIPHRMNASAGSVADLASQMSEELTSKRGRIFRCLGLYERLTESGVSNEIAFVINSSYVPENAVKEGTIWLPSNDIHRSRIADPAKSELDDFL
jgi:hypothetical protein